MLIKKIKRFLVPVIFLFVLIIILEIQILQGNLVNKNMGPNKISTISPSVDADMVRWNQEIDNLGAATAWADFKQFLNNDTPEKQHVMAHKFGQLLYQKVGLDGVEACDQSFGYGCYHSFIAEAIRVQGTDVLGILNQKCIDKYGDQSPGCQHGMGHGLIGSIGYDYPSLVQAATICQSLPKSDRIGGCISGAFMEYNFQTLHTGQSVLRLLDQNNPLYPCNQLDNRFQPACYFAQPQWWLSSMRGDYKQDFNKISKWCLPLNFENRTDCAKGAGNVTGMFLNWNVDQSIDLCQVFKDHDMELNCQIGAAAVYLTVPEVKDKAINLCNRLNTDDHKTCIYQSGVVKV